MIKTSKGCLTALFILSTSALPQMTLAADADGRYALEGPGRITCKALTEMDPSSQQMQLLASWTLGYMSAHNRVLSDTFDITPWQNIETVLGLTRQFCASNPDAPFEIAIQQLMTYLAPTRLKTQEQMVRIGDDTLQAIVYEGTLQIAREKLALKGYATPTDDESLSASLKSFQTDNALPPTGILDQATLRNLMK